MLRNSVAGTRILWHGALVLSMGSVLSNALSFLRNIILARALTKADFGLAAAFGTTVTLLDLVSRMSIGQQVIQSKQGASERFQTTAQAFQFLLALVTAALVLAMSQPAASLYGVPNAGSTFALLAVLPLARGLESLDPYRAQRDFRFLPSTLCELIPQTVTTALAWPLAQLMPDYRAIIWLLVGKSILGLFMSHLLSRRPYAWSWDSSLALSMWCFGWPLLMNGLLMFTSLQADQLIVASFLSVEQLASYALATSIVSLPWFLAAQPASSLMLPTLARLQDDSDRFRLQCRTCSELSAIASVLLMLPLITFGEQLVRLLYGSKYSGAGDLMAILGFAAAIRFLRFAPAIASMARADTTNQLIANAFRALSLPAAAAAALSGAGALGIASCGLLAEVAATLIAYWRLDRRTGVPLRDAVGPCCYLGGALSVGLLFNRLGTSGWSAWPSCFGTLFLTAGCLASAWLVFPRTIQVLVMQVTRFQNKRQPEP